MVDQSLGSVFWERKRLIGMVHLLPLPGSARHTGEGMETVVERAVEDAFALWRGGVDALMVENFFDAPFAKETVPSQTVAAMTRAVLAVRQAVDLPLGVNVLRNDARAALAIAHVCRAQFVRINVYVGAVVTDQGIIEGAARDAVLFRKELGAHNVCIWADVQVKHAAPLGVRSLEEEAQDAVHRGLADALIVSGPATGRPTDPETAQRARAAVPGTPILVGSGFTLQTAAALLPHAHGAIVGTALKQEGHVARPVDIERVRALSGLINDLNNGTASSDGPSSV